MNIPDPVLKAAIERALWISDPTPTDMLGMTDLGYIEDWGQQEQGIKSLTGLEYAANLRKLVLRFNPFSDISALSGLTNLSWLELSQNCIGDISPLSGLTNLTYLNLHANGFSDISPLSGLAQISTLILRFNNIGDISSLSGLKELRELDLGENHVADLSVLSSLTQLSELRLWSNGLSDISPLASLSNLRSVDLSRNQISDVSALGGLSGLQSVDLTSNQVRDLSALCGLTSLSSLRLRDNPLSEEAYRVQIPRIVANNPGISIEHEAHVGRLLSLASTVGGSVISPGEGVYTYDLNADVRIEAEADPGFTFAGWSGGVPSTQNPVFITMTRDFTVKAYFISPRTTLYVDDDAPADPAPGDPNCNDPDADGSPEHPVARIQDAIDVAQHGVVIYVLPGVYRENITLMGKRIQLKAVDPLNPNGGPCAVIEGTGGAPVVTIDSGIGSQCGVSGFVITRGRGAIVGAIECCESNPTLSNCLIVGNRCDDPNGAAIRFTRSRAVLSECSVVDNYAGENGAGMILRDSDITMTNSIFWGNRPAEISARGTSDPFIRYCCVRGWWPDLGNIHSDPLLVRPGYWADPADPTKTMARDNPHAVWTDGDYHVKSQAGRWDPALLSWVRDDVTSPAIDAGDPADAVGQEPLPNGKIINMGVYAGTNEASKSR
ncbi:MAG: leucine-rich repeat domain-containing protein [Phycisphaerales bacterium]